MRVVVVVALRRLRHHQRRTRKRIRWPSRRRYSRWNFRNHLRCQRHHRHHIHHHRHHHRLPSPIPCWCTWPITFLPIVWTASIRTTGDHCRPARSTKTDRTTMGLIVTRILSQNLPMTIYPRTTTTTLMIWTYLRWVQPLHYPHRRRLQIRRPVPERWPRPSQTGRYTVRGGGVTNSMTTRVRPAWTDRPSAAWPSKHTRSRPGRDRSPILASWSKSASHPESLVYIFIYYIISISLTAFKLPRAVVREIRNNRRPHSIVFFFTIIQTLDLL